MDIILINLNNFQEYIIDNINQLKYFKYNITIIITDNLLHHFNDIPDINIVKTSELDDLNYNVLSKLDDTYRNGFWKLCSQRLFYLYSYIKKYNIINSIHIENDVMIYDNFSTHFDRSKIWITMDSNNRCIPGIIFIPNYNMLDNLILNYDFTKNDMENLAIFYHKNKDICNTLPIIQKNDIYNNDDIYSKNFPDFLRIFDGAAIGQYLGGVDPRNISGDTRGFINETCVVDYSKYTFSWKINIHTNLYQPHILLNNVNIPIFNLHIHSKKLYKFNSKYPLETKLINFDNNFHLIKPIDYITGEKFQNIADIFLGLDEDFNFNPYIHSLSSKCINIININNTYDNPYIIFCYSHRLNLLKNIIHHFKNPFILITHNSDENITETYESLLYSNKIIRWYAQNILIKHPKLHLLPIGIANSMWPHGNTSIFDNLYNQLINKTKDFYFYFTESTNRSARELCKLELEKKGLVFGTNVEFNKYINDLAQYKFAICPPGNGIDSHRIWECYYLGVIPIVLRNSFTEQLDSILPCILLDNWSDFDQYTILPKYNNLLDKLRNNINYLDYTYYLNKIKSIKKKTVWFEEIGRSGNNIFQYLAAEVIKYIYNFDCVAKYDNTNRDVLIIDDEKYTTIINDYLQNPTNTFTSNRDILLYGFFQKSNILVSLRTELLKYFNTLNTTYINDKYTISDFSKKETSHNIIFDDDTILLHLRLDDYIHNNSPPNIFDKEEFSKFLDTISFKKLYILCDELKTDWEKKYINYFIEKYQAIILTGTIFDDFNLIKSAKNLITSQSTFSWIASYLGNANKVYIPYSNFYKEHQVLKDCHNNCTVIYGIPFATNLLS